MEEVSNLISICPTDPIQFFLPTWIFFLKILCVSFNTFDKNETFSCWDWSLTAKKGSLLEIKQT